MLKEKILNEDTLGSNTVGTKKSIFYSKIQKNMSFRIGKSKIQCTIAMVWW